MKAEQQVVSELEKRLDVAYHLPSLRWLGLGVAVSAIVVLLGWPLSAPSRRGSVSSGDISNHHRLIEPACEQCHASPFGAVADHKCASCHAVQQHVPAVPAVVEAHPDLGAHCTTCHKEHHGENTLVPGDSPLCTRCHARMDKLLPGSAQPGVSDFAHHPEFAVRAWSGEPPTLKKVRLDTPKLRDTTQLKFSHDEHLGQVLGTDGKPVLTCASCHQPRAEGQGIQPISYARHCERCHRIEFDDRLKDAFVPHGDAANVVGFVASQLAKLHVESSKAAGAATRELVAKEAREDELALFTPGGACFKCHDVEEVPPASLGQQGHFKVRSSDVPVRWMPASVFDHEVHRRTPCESCHAGVRESTSASDILLPRIARCRECHADPGTPGMISSPCLECHRYHAP